jgi:hypothetical protein
MTFYTPGDVARGHEAQEVKRAQEAMATAEQRRRDRIERWGRALSVLPADELTQLAQGWSSFTEAVKPSAERALQIQREKR